MRVVALTLCLTFAACSHEIPPELRVQSTAETYEDVLTRLAGVDRENCGVVAAGGDTTRADHCAADAFRAGRPFVAVYLEQGIDSQIGNTIVGTKEGAVVRVFYDSNICGGPNPCRWRIVETRCLRPIVISEHTG